MAVRYVQRRLNGGVRSIEEVEPPPESLEVSKYLSSVQRFNKIRGCRCRSNREMAFSHLNFDFDSPPKKVTWILNSFPEAPGSWTEFISGEMVPGHTRQEWDAAFTYHVHGVVASSSKGFQTPNRAIVSVEPTSSESQQRKRRRRRLNLVVSDDNEKRLDWLPSDWQVEYRRRESGAESSFPPTMHMRSPITTPDRNLHTLNDDEGFHTPNRAIVSVEPTSSESQQRKRRRRRLDLVVSEDNEKRPDWLPSDWQVEYRRREGGATAGLTDRYYYEPGSRRQFRSKKEVLCYLETGTRRKYKGKPQEKSNSGVNVTPSMSTGLAEQTGSSSEKRKRSPSKFDFNSPTKKVTWVLNSFPEAPGTWTSFISGEKVPGHSRQEWDAAFTYHVHGVVASSSKGIFNCSLLDEEVAVNLEAGA